MTYRLDELEKLSAELGLSGMDAAADVDDERVYRVLTNRS
jgi:hypothetical protein